MNYECININTVHGKAIMFLSCFMWVRCYVSNYIVCLSIPTAVWLSKINKKTVLNSEWKSIPGQNSQTRNLNVSEWQLKHTRKLTFQTDLHSKNAESDRFSSPTQARVYYICNKIRTMIRTPPPPGALQALLCNTYKDVSIPRIWLLRVILSKIVTIVHLFYQNDRE